MNTLKKIDYLPFLEACWQEHLQPRATNAPTVISTFAGAGGSSLGYSMAGFRELLAVEWDNNAVETFKLNFHDVPVYHGDIAKLSVEQVLEMTGLRSGELAVFDGSPPCQGFSTAGKRIMDDPRNSLFKEYVRLLRGLRPKVFVMENVSGMVKGKMKIIFAEILRELKASGYRVSARLLNAMYFGVPQSRERMIFIGVRDDFGIAPSHPVGWCVPVTVRQAISDLDDNGPESSASSREALKKMPEGANNGGGKYLSHTFGLLRLEWNKPCRTLIKEPLRHAMPSGTRFVSIDSAKRIASFCDDFKMLGSYNDSWQRIGNSVPPLFMRSIALHIRSAILDRLEHGTS